jgi:integrase/recombinase XerD
MAFSCKIILAGYKKSDGTKRVYLQAIIDRHRATVPLAFYIDPKSFDIRGNCMKSDHPNAKDFDTEFLDAKAKGNSIASKYRRTGKSLTAHDFKKEFDAPPEVEADKSNFIEFIRQDLKDNEALAENTVKQHNTVINKLTAFRPVIQFDQLNSSLMTQFKNKLSKTLNVASVNKILKITKYYCIKARKLGHKFEDPFITIKIRKFKSQKMGLTENEIAQLNKYFVSADCKATHKSVLRCFLFSCYTGVRISDIGEIRWNQINDDILSFIPTKTKYTNNQISVPLGTLAKKYLPKFEGDWNQKIFGMLSDQYVNRILKEIADKVEIRKKVTYHTSRHTFGTLFADGGDIVALQQIMGHEDIKTTMEYVHTNVNTLVKAVHNRFEKKKPKRQRDSLSS